MYVVVSGGSIALVAPNGDVLPRTSWPTLSRPRQTVIAGDTIAMLHSAIDTGVGDSNVVFVVRFTTGRHRAARP